MLLKQFMLAGKKHLLSQETIEKRLAGATPKTVDRYWVAVNGSRFPPKQIVGTALGMPLSEFTTQDACRILRKLGFRIEDPQVQERTTSELLFERYLSERGLSNFLFEQPVDGTTSRPDYTLTLPTGDVYCEVKEFRATAEDFRLGFGSFDPFPPIREKIVKARKKFQEMKGRCCNLVLFNVDKPLIFLDAWHIYGAMMGNPAFSVPINLGRRQASSDKVMTVFTQGGKMLHRGEPQNTSISSIIVLEHLPVGYRRFKAFLNERERELGRGLTIEEIWNLSESSQGTERDSRIVELRVAVYENPFAATSLPDVFRGPYDERYGVKDGHIVCFYEGTALASLPTE